MSVVSQLCSEVLWLDHGTVVRRGQSRGIVAAYLAEGISGDAEWRPARDMSEAFQYHSVGIENPGAADTVTIPADRPFAIRFDFTVKGPLMPGRLALEVVSADGLPVFASASTDAIGALHEPWKLGHQIRRCIVPAHFLVPGQYLVTITEPTESGDAIHEHVLSFTITEQNSLIARDRRRGIVAPLLEWTEERA
jgi:lipopolysaccharide transport system ATP-binding protein